MSYSTLNYELEHSETKQRYWTHNHRPVYNIMASLASESPSEHNGWGARASPAETLPLAANGYFNDFDMSETLPSDAAFVQPEDSNDSIFELGFPTSDPTVSSHDATDYGTLFSVPTAVPESNANRRSLATVVKSESLALVGAQVHRVEKFRMDGSTYFQEKHTLPDPAEPDALSRYDMLDRLLYNPEWSLGPRYSKNFLDAVVMAVEQVRSETNGTIRRATLQYFKTMRRNYVTQAKSLMQLGLGDKENFEAKQLGRIRDIKFKAKLAGL